MKLHIKRLFLSGRMHPVAFARVENLDVSLCLLKVFDDFWMIVVQNGDLLNFLVGKYALVLFGY